MVTALALLSLPLSGLGRASRRRLSGSDTLEEHMGGNSAESTASASRPEWAPSVS